MTFAIVTNADRDWALAQKPYWARMYDDVDPDEGEIVDDDLRPDEVQSGKHRDPSWFSFVIGEIESFERYFGAQQKGYAEWSALWRKGWWPKRREDWKFKNAPKEFQPFFRAGTPEFERALEVATGDEKRMWSRFGVAQFKPDDERLKRVQWPLPSSPQTAHK